MAGENGSTSSVIDVDGGFNEIIAANFDAEALAIGGVAAEGALEIPFGPFVEGEAIADRRLNVLATSTGYTGINNEEGGN